jgi:hypothetical protein
VANRIKRPQLDLDASFGAGRRNLALCAHHTACWSPKIGILMPSRAVFTQFAVGTSSEFSGRRLAAIHAALTMTRGVVMLAVAEFSKQSVSSPAIEKSD